MEQEEQKNEQERPIEKQITRILEEKNSVGFSINQKGKLSAECKCYALTPEEAEKEAIALQERLRAYLIENNREKTQEGAF